MTLDELYQVHGTLVFGHRGACAYTPENTIPSFLQALEMGAHGVELDVHLSKDGVPVVIHDFGLEKTTNGTGLVVEKTLDELKALDAGIHKGAAFAGTRIPTLDEVFEALGGRIAVNVEVKADTDGIEQVVAECIARHGMNDLVIISSFKPTVLRRFAETQPHLKLGFLIDPTEPQEVNSIYMSAVKHHARHPFYMTIDRAYVRVAHQFGYRVNTWTVNDPDHAINLAEMGVDCVMSDMPDVMLKALGHRD
jgi:glycerophosphoryl diester phosphodiesterase